MGMYTELNLNVELPGDIPKEVLDTLEYMLGVTDEPKSPIPNHPLFTLRDDRWTYMLRCDSYYFSADTHSTLRFDDISHSFFLCIQCNLKNYNSEIENFVDWIKPYVDATPGAFLGYSRYEECETPTLIHM